jgi:hypothetical protein
MSSSLCAAGGAHGRADALGSPQHLAESFTKVFGAGRSGGSGLEFFNSM